MRLKKFKYFNVDSLGVLKYLTSQLLVIHNDGHLTKNFSWFGLEGLKLDSTGDFKIRISFIDHATKVRYLNVDTKVFKGESVRQNVFVSLRQGISLEALRHKPFETIIFRINKY